MNFALYSPAAPLLINVTNIAQCNLIPAGTWVTTDIGGPVGRWLGLRNGRPNIDWDAK